MIKILLFSAYMSGGSSSPSASSAQTIYQLSSLPPPTTLSDASIDTDLLKPPGNFHHIWPRNAHTLLAHMSPTLME